jgi:hypothetical protein
LIFLHASLAFHSRSLRLGHDTIMPWGFPGPGPNENFPVSTSIAKPTNASSRTLELVSGVVLTVIPLLSNMTCLPERHSSARSSSGTVLAFSEIDICLARSRKVRTCQSASMSHGSGSPDIHSFLSIRAAVHLVR